MPKIIPYGNRILVERKKVGSVGHKDSKIILTQETADRPTDLATVISIPDNTFVDKQLIERAEQTAEALGKKMEEGNPDALEALLKLNFFMRIKALQPGDEVFVTKYCGTDFHDTRGGKYQSMIKGEDILAFVAKE